MKPRVTRICTFGFGQPHQNEYCIVTGDSEDDIRDFMNKKFNKKWANMYGSKEDAGIEEFNHKMYGMFSI